MPKTNKRVKFLLDVDPLELARQLTIVESQLYQRIRPIECLSRSREQKTDHNDNIARVIQTSNRVCSHLGIHTRANIPHKIANWVADAVLVHDDSRKRAAVLKQFISIADVGDLYGITILPLTPMIALSVFAQLFQYGCYRIWAKLASYSPVEAFLGTSQFTTHVVAECLRDDD